MDYRNLLRKYIEYVGNMEGVNFINNASAPYTFSSKELNELKALEAESDYEWKKPEYC